MLRRGFVHTFILIAAGVVALVAGITAPPAAAGPVTGTMLRDMSKRPTVTAGTPTRVGTLVYFTTRIDSSRYDSLWRTDGTAGGTVKLRSFLAGTSGLTAVGDRLFFAADDGVHGREPWVSDGTAAGTVLVKDVVAGAASSSPTSLAAFGAGVAFDARGTAPGLWVSDGTAAGTTLIRRSTATLTDVTAVGSQLYFTVAPSIHNVQLWVSDGTAAGTAAVKSWTVNTASTAAVRIGKLTALGSQLIFVRGDWSTRNYVDVTLWRSDGTAGGTTVLRSWRDGYGSELPLRQFAFCVVGPTLYFTERLGPMQGPAGLWRTDGTAAGTVVVTTDIPYAFEIVASGSELYLTDAPPGYFDSQAHLWRSDGTAAGTSLIVSGAVVTAAELTVSQGMLFFFGRDHDHAQEVWVSDGTPVGTHLIVDQIPGDYLGPDPQALADLGTTMMWTAWDGSETWLWRSDGTAAGTTHVARIDTHTAGSHPNEFTLLDGKVYFTAANEVDQPGALWRTDGTGSGTAVVHNFTRPDPPGPDRPGGIDTLRRVGNRLFFNASDPAELENCAALWTTDGSTFVDLTGNATFSGDLLHAAAVGTQLVFQLVRCYSGNLFLEGLWKTDGTFAGTVPIPNTPNTWPGPPTAAGGYVYFSAAPDRSPNDHELWRTNRALTDSMRIKDIRPGTVGSLPQQVTAVGNRVFFTADDGVHGRELWVSNGSAAGTHLVRELRPGRASPDPQELTAVGNTLYFRAWDATHGWELWKSDGTATGTKLVRDIRPGYTSSVPRQLTALGTTLYFTATDTAHGGELWKTDGTAAGTVLVRDINPGTSDSRPAQLTVIGTTLVFTANDGVHGAEPWTSTGTAAGTQLLADINAWGSSHAYGYTYANNTMIFGADDGWHGAEPYALPWTN